MILQTLMVSSAFFSASCASVSIPLNMATSDLKVVYFDARGAAELTRILLSVGGIISSE